MEELYEKVAKDVDTEYIYVGFNRVRELLQACIERWQKAWQPGWLLVVDETMI
jgi:hypothetical protein